MSEEQEQEQKPKFEKGARAAVVAGRKNLGVRGEVFWIGENKYGPGVRYGLKGDDGDTYWVDEANIGEEKDAPPAPEPPPRDAKPKLAKGTRVQITGGRDGAGETGEVFWVGESRYGKGNRYGIRGKDDATFWVDDEFVEPLDPPAGGDAGAATADGHDPAPLPNPDDFAADFADDAPIHDGAPLASDAPAEFAGGDDAPFPSEDDEAAGGAGGGGFDAPFPDDDIPF